MKYLFFFKGQPLLVCCVCCKIAIQDFLRGLHEKNKKNLPFHRRIYPSVFHRELQKNYRILPQSPTDIPTDHACLTHVRLHEYRRHFQRNIPTELPTEHACLTRVRLHEYRWHFRRNYRRIEKFGGIFDFFGANFN